MVNIHPKLPYLEFEKKKRFCDGSGSTKHYQVFITWSSQHAGCTVIYNFPMKQINRPLTDA